MQDIGREDVMSLQSAHEHEHSRHQNQKRSFVQHRIDRLSHVIPVGHHLSAATEYDCIVRTISSAGAIIDLSGRVELPENFFLRIGGMQDEIGCTQVRRVGDERVVRFNMFLDADYLKLVMSR